MTGLAPRPWRNLNPGDLRCLPAGQHWQGQTGVDNGPGGPFAIFGNEADGWGALATCLLAYQDLHGLHTVRSMIGRYAPAFENDTGGYVSLVCKQLGVAPDGAIDVHRYPTMLALVQAIALAEGGRQPWSVSAQTIGVMGALARGVRTAHAAVVPAPMHPAEAASDALNEAEMARVTTAKT